MKTRQNFYVWCICLLLTVPIPLVANAAQVDSSRMYGSRALTGDTHALAPPERWVSLQVGAFARPQLAERAVSHYQGWGYDAFCRYEDTGTKGMLYRVYVGRYPSRMEAQDAAGTLVRQNMVDAYILRELSVQQDEINDAIQQHEQTSSLLGIVNTQKNTGDPDHKRTGNMSKPPETTGSAIPWLASSASRSHPNGADRLETKKSSVRISLLDAIRYSLEGNREIKVVSYEPKKSREKFKSAESVYDVQLFADSIFRRDPNLESSVSEIITEDGMRARAGIRKPLRTGGSISTYMETTFEDENHSGIERRYKYSAAPTVELKQPLLNNIGSQKEQTDIKIAKYRANISDSEFRRKAIEVTNKVAKAYWQIYMHRAMVDINRKNLEMAEEVHRREAVRHGRGISQELDVARAKSNAEVRRSTLLGSQEAYRLTMNRLKLMLNWKSLKIDSGSHVVPIEEPTMPPVEVDEAKAIEKALENRPEIVKARQELMIREVDLDLAAHQRLPTLDFFGRYSASGYGEKFDTAWDDITINDDDAWEVGIQFELLLGNRLAKSRQRYKSLGRMQATAQLKRVADDIKLDVKQVVQRLATLQHEIIANQQAKAAAVKVVEGEFSRFDIGQTSNEELLRAQDLLAVTSRNHVRALANYNSAIQDLARAQGVLPKGVLIEEAGQ